MMLLTHRGGRVHVVRFVGGPMHCYPVPSAVMGTWSLGVKGNNDASGPFLAQYSLGVFEDEDTGDRFIFYGWDMIDDWDEMVLLVLQACRPC